MVSILIIVILAISLAAAAGFALLTLIYSSDLALNIQRNQVRMDAAASALGARVYAGSDGALRVPLLADGDDAPDGEGSGAGVPSLSPFSRTSWGARVVYCPAVAGTAAPDAGAVPVSIGGYPAVAAERNSPTGEGEVGVTYVTQAMPTFSAPPSDDGGAFDGFRAVTAEDLRRMGVVAYLVSPSPSQGAGGEASCGDVYVSADGGFLTSLNGAVTPVYGLNGRNGGAGGGDAFNVGGDTTMEVAISRAFRSGSSNVTFNLNPGDTRVSELAAARLEELTRSASVRIVGRVDGSGAPASFLNFQFAATPQGAGHGQRFHSASVLQDLVMRGFREVQSSDGSDGGVPTFEVTETFDVGVEGDPTATLRLVNARVGFLRGEGAPTVLGAGSAAVPKFSPEARAMPIVSRGGTVTVDGGVVVVAPVATAGIRVMGGDATVLGVATMTLANGSPAYSTDLGGRVMPAFANPTVTVNGTSLPIEEAAVHGSLNDAAGVLKVTGRGAGRRLVVPAAAVCADGSAGCTATCPASTNVAWGECGSSNGQPLSAFGADAAGRSWSCRWATPMLVVGPTSKVVCQGLPQEDPAPVDPEEQPE